MNSKTLFSLFIGLVFIYTLNYCSNLISMVNKAQEQKNQALFESIMPDPNYEKAKKALELGADPNALFKGKWFPYEEDLPFLSNVILGLWDAKTNIYLKPEKSKKIKEELLKIFDLLLEKDVDVNLEGKYSNYGIVVPLFFAAKTAQRDLFKKLLDHEADISKVNLDSVLRAKAQWIDEFIFCIVSIENKLILNEEFEEYTESIIHVINSNAKNSCRKSFSNLEHLDDILWFFDRLLSKYPDKIDLLPEDYQKVLNIYKQLKSRTLSAEDLTKIRQELKKETDSLYDPIKLVIGQIIYLIKEKGLAPDVAYKTVLEFPVLTKSRVISAY